MLFFLSLFWLIREIKAILFWLYLWQLKEYHLGRFIDHFQTEKGKKIFLNKIFLLKLILLLIFLSFGRGGKIFFVIFLIILYFFELEKGIYDFLEKTLKTPIFTKKIIFLIFLNLIFLAFYSFSFSQQTNFFPLSLLIFDLLTPAIVSGTLLIFQPLVVLRRNQIIKKATKKRKKHPDLLVIGITGSYGKTSTKEFLSTILAEEFKVLKTKEHQNSEVGISQCILEELKEDHQIFVCEMGAYNRGGIKLLGDIVKPKIGILTGINEQHLATFGSMENLISAEGGRELIETLPREGLMIFNGVNTFCQKIYQETKINKKIIILGPENLIPADFWAENIKIEKEFLAFKIISRDGDSADFRLNLLGAQNIENILLAACCAKELGMNLREISRACQKLKPLPKQMELRKGREGLNIIDSTYSTNPSAVISHLEYLKIWPEKKVIVMPCLIELGSASKEIHKRIGKKIAEVCDLAIITTKDRFKEIKEEAEKKAIFLENPKEIFQKIKSFCQEGDIVLLEGRVPNQLIDFLVG